MIRANGTLSKLDAGEPALGAWTLAMSPRVAEVLSRTGVDWIGIDAEHTPVAAERVEDVVRAIEGGDATPIVRLPSVEAAVAGGAKHALDSGAQGVIVPGVESREDAEAAVRATYVPPEGERGLAGTTRANRYGEAFDAYAGGANDETLLVVQIETPAAVENTDEILGVDGIDVAFIGENDLSSAYGHPGEKDRAEVKEAVEAVLDAAEAHGVHPGIAGRTPENVTERIERGFRFFLLGADVTFMRNGVAPFLDR